MFHMISSYFENIQNEKPFMRKNEETVHLINIVFKFTFVPLNVKEFKFQSGST